MLPTDEGAGNLPIEQRIRLYAAVEALGEAQRSAIYLHYWLGETVDDIAILLDRRPGTVKSLLHRARRKLGRLLGGEMFDEGTL